MNSMVVIDTPNAVKYERICRPTRAANQSVKRDPNGSVVDFENMDPREAEALMSAMDKAFAEL